MRHIKQVISDSCIYGGLIQMLHHTLMSGGVFESAPLFIFKEENNGKEIDVSDNSGNKPHNGAVTILFAAGR